MLECQTVGYGGEALKFQYWLCGKTCVFVSVVYIAVAAAPPFALAQSEPANDAPVLNDQPLQRPADGSSLTGRIYSEVRTDWVFNTDPLPPNVQPFSFNSEGAFDLRDTTTKIQLELQYYLTDRLTISTVAPYQIVRPTVDDRTFDDLGLFAEELYATYAGDVLDAKAGKFTLNFGQGYRDGATDLLFGNDFSEAAAELTEHIGFEVGASLNNRYLGDYRLSVSTYYLDDTFLSNSLFVERGEIDRIDGGLANTGGFDSFGLAFTGKSPFGIGPLNYHAAYVHRAAGITETANENAFTGSLWATIPIHGIDTKGFVEYVGYWDADGVADRKRDLLTLGLRFEKNGWFGAGEWNMRKTRDGQFGTLDDYLVGVSAGYSFENGLQALAGYSHLRESGQDSDRIGVQLINVLPISY